MKTSIHIAILSLAASGVLALASRAQAAVIVLAPTASTPGSFQITNDITFTIGTAGNALVFVLDEWVTSDGAPQNLSPFSPGLSVSINGGAPASQGTGNFSDNFTNTVGALTPNDGLIFLNTSFAVSIGNTVTLKPATYSLGALSGFNPQGNQTFTGNMFMTNSGGVRLSNIVSAGPAPEPSTCALLLLGGLGAAARRRRATSPRTRNA